MFHRGGGGKVWGVEQELLTIQDHLAQIVETVQNYAEPGGRILLAAQVYEEMRRATALLGQYGIRGEAATELIKLTGSARDAASAIQSRYGVDISPSALNRLAKR